jgi:CDP-glycerol glycerophosphotransferase (TagB/SpsB family)
MDKLKKFVKLIILPFSTLLYHFSGLFCRKPNVWVFGTQKNFFADNTKHLFIYVTANSPDIKAVWITADFAVIRRIRAAGGKAYFRWSFLGIYYTISSKYWFITTTVAEINYYTSKNSSIVNLWHGLPLKRIYFDTDNIEDYNRYHHPSFLQKIAFEPFTYRLSDYLISTSKQISLDSFSSALKVQIDNCLTFGQARTDILFYRKAEYLQWLSKWGSPSLESLINMANVANRVWIYMPTWREANPRFLEQVGLNFKRINSELKRKNELLILKLHPYTPKDLIDNLRNNSNIAIAESHEDMYPLLSISSCLITDYSSIYIDYLLLDKPIIFFCFDYEEYIEKSRGFYYSYDEVTPGDKVFSAEELEGILCANEIKDEWGEVRGVIRNKFFTYKDGNSAKRTTEFFKATTTS